MARNRSSSSVTWASTPSAAPSGMRSRRVGPGGRWLSEKYSSWSGAAASRIEPQLVAAMLAALPALLLGGGLVGVMVAQLVAAAVASYAIPSETSPRGRSIRSCRRRRSASSTCVAVN